jgi:limonene-1,2-epoxide hydrolase
MSHEQRTVDFFANWSTSFDGMCDAFREHLADRCEWDQRPVAVTHGIDEAIRFLTVSRRTLGLATVDVEMLHVASAGDVVHTERIDHLRRADGGLIASAPVAGILEFEGDRIVAWREHFDPVGFAWQASGSGLAHVMRIASRRVARSFRGR